MEKFYLNADICLNEKAYPRKYFIFELNPNGEALNANISAEFVKILYETMTIWKQ